MSDVDDAESMIPRCVALQRSGSCGAPGGQEVFLASLQPSRQVRVTVRKTWMDEHGNPMSEDTPYTLDAGERRRIGCTSEASSPPTNFKHVLIGCQVL
jgi:hypothetical protein